MELLQDALRKMRNSEMDSIGALSDLRVYLSNQEHVGQIRLPSFHLFSFRLPRLHTSNLLVVLDRYLD